MRYQQDYWLEFRDTVGIKMAFRKSWRQIISSIVVALASASQGVAIAFPSAALPQMRDPESSFYLTKNEASMMVGVLMLSAAAANIITAAATSILSRKYLLAISAIPTVFGFILVAVAPNYHTILLGRAIIGFTTGVAIPAGFVYISEITDPHIRSTMATFPVLFSGLGSLLVYVLSTVTSNWRTLTWITSVIPVAFMILVLFIPRSPRFLLMKNKEKEAEEALIILKGKSVRAKEELFLAKQYLRDSYQSNNIVQCLAMPYMLKSWTYAHIVSILYASCGGALFVTFIEPLAISMNSPISPEVVSVIVGFTEIGCALLILLVANFFGRRTFLQVSSLLMFLSLLCLVLTLSFVIPTFPNYPSLLYLPPILLIVFMAAFSLGFKTMGFAYISEFLPSKIRGCGTCSACTVSAVILAGFSYGYGDMLDGLGLNGYFLIFCVISLICFIFSTLFLPETKGKTLEQVENEIRSGRVLLGLNSQSK